MLAIWTDLVVLIGRMLLRLGLDDRPRLLTALFFRRLAILLLAVLGAAIVEELGAEG